MDKANFFRYPQEVFHFLCPLNSGLLKDIQVDLKDLNDYVQDKDRHISCLLKCDTTLVTFIRMLNYSFSDKYPTNDNELENNICNLADKLVFSTQEIGQHDKCTISLRDATYDHILSTPIVKEDVIDMTDIVEQDEDIINDLHVLEDTFFQQTSSPS